MIESNDPLKIAKEALINELYIDLIKLELILIKLKKGELFNVLRTKRR